MRQGPECALLPFLILAGGHRGPNRLSSSPLCNAPIAKWAGLGRNDKGLSVVSRMAYKGWTFAVRPNCGRGRFRIPDLVGCQAKVGR